MSIEFCVILSTRRMERLIQIFRIFFIKAQLFSREINLYGFGFEQIILRIVGFGPILNEKLFSPAVHYFSLSF